VCVCVCVCVYFYFDILVNFADHQNARIHESRQEA
jgi:hypothetical protein